MATSDQKIKVYVSKIETDTGEKLVVRSNVDDNTLFVKSIPILNNASEEEFMERIKNFMTIFFKGIACNLESSSVKFSVEYFFNKEYSAKGEVLYHNFEEEISTLNFLKMFWVELKKPLTGREIELFIKALRAIPFC